MTIRDRVEPSRPTGERHVVLALLALSILSASLPHALGMSAVKSLWSFGDEYLDTGSTVYFPRAASRNCSRPPYGVTKHEGSGRCSNGEVLMDQIAEQMKLSTPGPYLGPDEWKVNGVNFAVAGAGVLESTNKWGSVSLQGQLYQFQQYLKTSNATTNLTESLVLISFGMNDYINALWTGNDPVALVDVLVPQIASLIVQIQRLSGAYRFIVLSVPPLGCVPLMRAYFHSPPETCLTNLNAVSLYHDQRLGMYLDLLSKQQPNGIPLLYSMVSLTTAMADPKVGFPAFTKPWDVACGTVGSDGKIYDCGATIPTSAISASSQGDESEGGNAGSKAAVETTVENDIIGGYDYWWWDWLNPTHNAIYDIWIIMWLGGKAMYPITVMQLYFM